MRTSTLTLCIPAKEAKFGAMSNGTTQNVYTAYNNVVYKFNGNHASVLWQFPFKQAYQPDRRIGSYLQLAVVKHVVYAAIEYGIYALDANTGKQIWHYAPQLTPAALAQDRGRITEMYVDQSVMYLEMTRGDMAALDLQTGALKWSHLSFPNGGSFSASEFSTKQIPILHAIDGMTGKEHWHFERQLINTSISSTFIFNGVVYSSGNPLYALDARIGKKLWEQRLPMGPAYFDDLHLRNGVLYVNTDAYSSGSSTSFTHYVIYAIHLANGATNWKYNIGALLDVQVPITELILAP